MQLIEACSYETIEQHLKNLGPYDIEDTRTNIGCYPNFYRICLDEPDFWTLVFLQTPEVSAIAPVYEDRRLRAVAERALRSGSSRLSDNWDLESIQVATKKCLHSKPTESSPFLLRDLKERESSHHPAFKYIHDGCHRCLGYAMALLTDGLTYQPIEAFLATNDILKS